MYQFPEKLYADVRIDNVSEINIRITDGSLEELKNKNYQAAFIRIFDGTRWYYSSATDIERIQEKIDTLAAMADPSDAISSHPVVSRLEVHRAEVCRFDQNDLSLVPAAEKRTLLESYIPLLKDKPYVVSWTGYYKD